MSSCTPQQAERLARAIRIRTTTVRSSEPARDPAFAPFEAFFVFLRTEFPTVASRLQWERICDVGLLASWLPASGGAAAPAVLLYAHCDVVPAGDRSRWSHGPFDGDVADGWVWGRGALDDKGTLIAVFEALEALAAEGWQPAVAVHVAVGCDEEARGTGARSIAQALAGRGVRLACVLDEGSVIARGMLPFFASPIALVGTSEKGVADVAIQVEGSAGHAAMPGARTAAGVLAAIVADLERHPFPARLIPAVDAMFRCLGRHAGGAARPALRLLRPLLPLAAGLLGREVGALLRTTQAVTRLAAGEAENVLPSQAGAVVNLRILPGDTAAGVVARLRRRATRLAPRGFGLTVELAGDACDPVAASPDAGAAWDAITATLRDLVPEAVVAPTLVTAYTDSRHFAPIADAVYRLMPAVLERGEIARVHGFDERISLENYGLMIAFYRGVIARLARGTVS